LAHAIGAAQAPFASQVCRLLPVQRNAFGVHMPTHAPPWHA
jgi:hypothetical protein